MIRTSPLVKGVALTLASGLVLGATHLAWTEQDVKIAGTEPAQAKLGSSFEDMVEGVLTPEAIDDAPLTPEPPLETADQPDVKKADQPQTEAALQPALRETTSALPPNAAAMPKVRPTEASKPVPLLAPPSPDAVLPTVVALTPTQSTLTPEVTKPLVPKPVETAQTPLAPVTPQVMESTPTFTTPTETVAADEPESAAPPLSIRPQRRDPEKAARVAAARPKPKKPKVTRKKQPKQQVRRGNAQQNNTQGAANGVKQAAKAPASGKGAQAVAQGGNAARDNYPGQVMRKIRRARKPTVRARGAAIVAFRVAASGGLAGVSIARTSGSAALDQAALRVVKTAAPFPKPPSGAQRSFSVTIKGS